MLRVTILEKGGDEQRLTFNHNIVSIGRVQGNDIVLPKGNISKRHAQMVLENGEFVLTDLQSTNGTYVNKERINTPRTVIADDKVYMGDFVLHFHESEGGEGIAMEADDAMAVAGPETEQYGAGEVAEILQSNVEDLALDGAEVPLTEQDVPEELPGAIAGEAEGEHEDVELQEPNAEADDFVDEDHDESTRMLDSAELAGSLEDNALSDNDGEMESPIEFGVDSPVAEEILPPPEDVAAEEALPPPPEDLAAEEALPPPPEDLAAEEEALPPPPEDLAAEEALPPPPEDLAAEEVSAELVFSPVDEAPAAEAGAEDSAESLQEADETAAQVDESPVAGEDSADRFEQYVAALGLLGHRASENIFAHEPVGSEPLSDSEWGALEASVREVIDGAGAEGVIPEFLDKESLTQDLLYEFTGLGPIEYFLADNQATKLLVNDFNRIYVTRNGVTEMVWKSFSNPAAFERALEKLVSVKGFGAQGGPPIIDGDLPDGTWFQVLLPPLAPSGAVLTCLKRQPRTLWGADLVAQDVLTEEMHAYLGQRIVEGANVFVSGRSQPDRTSLLNALCDFFAADDRIIVAEGLPSVSLAHQNVVRVRIPVLHDESQQLFHMLPTMMGDRIVVDVGGGSAAGSLLHLALDGTEGILAAVYGQSVDDAVTRLTAQVQLSPKLGTGAGASLARTLIGVGLDVLVHVHSTSGGLRVTSVTDVTTDPQTQELTLNTRFSRDATAGEE